jgi:hypothetical protein
MITRRGTNLRLPFQHALKFDIHTGAGYVSFLPALHLRLEPRQDRRV